MFTATYQTMCHVFTLLPGNPISLSDQRYIINANNYLEIFVTNTEDTAQYACTAKNPVGDVTKTISLVIRGEAATITVN